MSGAASILARRNWWTVLIGLVAAATWVVAVGVGWRAWILRGSEVGIVAHVDAVGVAAGPWMIVAAILTLTTVVMGLGVAVVRHLVDGPVEALPTLPTLEEKEPLEELPERSTPKELVPADDSAEADRTGDPATDETDAGAPDVDANEIDDSVPEGSDAVDDEADPAR